MKQPFDNNASLYILTDGKITAHITDFGATIQRLYVPDASGKLDDVVLGFDTCMEYAQQDPFFGTVIGRSANRTKNGQFVINGKTYQMGINNGVNNLHCGPDYYKDRLWKVEEATESSIRLMLESPDGDQGFPGNAVIRVTYLLENGALHLIYDAVSDQDTVFNLTNHSYFNLRGHQHPEGAMEQELMMPARHFTPDDAQSIPTGELRDVAGTPMDFRTPKPIGRDIDMDYDALNLQGGYDHNFEVWCNPCAVVRDPVSGRVMEVETDCCGVQFYSGNFLNNVKGKDGACYTKRSAICLETQFYPNAINTPQWKQPLFKAGQPFHSETVYRFK